MRKKTTGIFLFVVCIAAACNAPVTGDVASVTDTAVGTTRPSPATASAPAPSPVIPPAGVEETIMILEPGPGSRLVSPLHVAGWSDPTFEQTLSVRLLSMDGSEVSAPAPAQIAADVGQRGPFAVEIPFMVSGEQNALIQVLSYSPRDGGVSHLSSVGVTLLPAGSASSLLRPPYPEQVAVLQPGPGATISGGVVHVEGVAIPSFEGTLVVEIYDEAGNLLASEPLIVAAPDIGLPGTFSLDLAYGAASAGPGRVVVKDPSPAFDGVNHLASVEVRFQP